MLLGFHQSILLQFFLLSHFPWLSPAVLSGVVMLGRGETSLSGIMEKTVDAMIEKKEIGPGDRDEVLKALMQSCR